MSQINTDASFEELPVEIVESIVQLLDVADIGSLRLASRPLNSKATQGHFRSFFFSKRVKVNSCQLEKLEFITKHGFLGCQIRDLTLVGLVYDTKGLKAAVRRHPEDSEKQHDLKELSEQEVDYEDSRDSGLIVRLLGNAFRNIAAKSRAGKLHSLSLEVAVYRLDAQNESRPSEGENWQPVWQGAAETFHTVFSSLRESWVRVDDLNIFNEPYLQQCSIASNELSSVISCTDGLSHTLESLRSLSISMSAPIVNFSQFSDGWAHKSDSFNAEDNEESEEDEETRITRLVTKAYHEKNFNSFGDLVAACRNLKSLEIHQYSVNRSWAHIRVPIPMHRLFQHGIGTLVTLPPIEECSLNGVFLRESDILGFLQKSTNSLRRLSMKTVTMVKGSYVAVFDHIARKTPNLDYLYLDELRLKYEWIHFTGVGDPKFNTWEGAHGGNTLTREGKEEAQQPIPYHLPTGGRLPYSTPSYHEWLQAQRLEYGPHPRSFEI
ncbi:hypothetical protein PFICI_11289 [Pestalotiopsis fici W106-1]|uniref:F-box domain-containing protein n=1 Tax=Pestalotiopsis fici (strain W106-1 / CGMCC3.15140) TaxID=1229662 RepID=W3WU90_PESFW|nr:uncharacterized protein PFICI_11289 [Pestalotiopsis fici W106-1]ETS77415.1 hypothetical protein PFICI_11289 [Pestalotiopsis fici W106-1]